MGAQQGLTFRHVPMTQNRAYWWCQLGGWGLYALGEIAVIAAFSPYVLWGVFINALNLPLGIGLTHAYRAVIRWRGWTRLPLLRLAPRVAGATVVLSLAFIAGSTGIALTTNLWSPFGGVALAEIALPDIINQAFRFSPIMLLWSVLYFGVHYFRRYRSAEIDRLEMAVQSRDAKLDALRLQLNPHFLFNSLNSVRALVVEAPRQAQQMITKLARLLRTTLRSSETTTVPLRDELDLVQTYLDLEAVRLEERLTYTIDADAATLGCAVPPMLMQTLVENAIKHGVAPAPEGGRVHVEARRQKETLHLRVRNTGHLEQTKRDGGVGLQNVRERLRLLFGDAATLTLRNADAETVLAAVQIPCTAEPVPKQETPAAEPALSSA